MALAARKEPLARADIRLAFVTPVHRRHELTRLCMQHRARMIEELEADGLTAFAVMVGDDPYHSDTANMTGAEWVEWPNDAPALGAKFNAGYEAAAASGATHVFAIGSDSWLHPSALDDIALYEDAVTSFAPLSCMRPDGLERLDMNVRYEAGFGVGMIYPVKHLPAEPCDPTKSRGCDSSTWRRVGHGKLGVKWHEGVPARAFVNFSSPVIQVTDYRKLTGVHRATTTVVRGAACWHGLSFGDWDQALVERVAGLYASRSIACFLTGTPFEDRYGQIEKPADWRGGIWPPKDGRPKRPLRQGRGKV